MINLEKLCSNNIIFIDKVDNNLNNNVEPLINNYISIENNGINYNFRLINYENNIFQIQCLNTLKYLIIGDNFNLFFIEFFKVDNNNLNNTLFYSVYDKYSVCFFPINQTNMILTYIGQLSLKNIETTFSENDQTIFLYKKLKYINRNLTILSKQLYLEKDFGIYISNKIAINNIFDIFSYIYENYENIDNKIFIMLQKSILPLNFILNKENYTIIDRELNIHRNEVRNRIIKLGMVDIENIPILTNNNESDYMTNDWYRMDNIIDKKLFISLWLKYIDDKINDNVFFNSHGNILITKDMVYRNDRQYYLNIVNLLKNKKSEELDQFFIIALYSIFYKN